MNLTGKKNVTMCGPRCGEMGMVAEILHLLKERGPLSLKELSVSCGIDPSAMEGMLEMLERKGRVERLETPCAHCKGCVEVKRGDALIFKVR